MRFAAYILSQFCVNFAVIYFCSYTKYVQVCYPGHTHIGSLVHDNRLAVVKGSEVGEREGVYSHNP